MAANKNTVIFIIGPTAIGKTRLAIKLARRIKGEIISCDSMQVYKGMHILSQAPSRSEKRQVKHYLIETLNPKEEYSVAIFKKKASQLISSVINKRKIPIIVGGSGLYIKALIDGLFSSPQADSRFRKSMQKFVDRYGNASLHKKLLKIDPESAAQIHPNDTRRIIRALEIYALTKKSMTELKKETVGIKDKYRIEVFGLLRSRERIYKDINLRIDKMFNDGLIKEVKRLKKKNMSKTAKAVLGFKEISGYLNGEYDLETAKEILKRNTRHFAKRQFSWFRADNRIRWFDLDRISQYDVTKNIIKNVKDSKVI